MVENLQEFTANDKNASAAERQRRLRELECSPAWQEEILPVLQTFLSDHIEAAISQSNTPAQRAEHIEAIHTMRKVISLPNTLANKIAAARKLDLSKNRQQ